MRTVANCLTPTASEQSLPAVGWTCRFVSRSVGGARASVGAGWALSLLAVLWPVLGCRAIPGLRDHSEQHRPPRARGAVSQLQVLWADAMKRQGTVPVQRGFAAKVYLFGPDSPQPLTCDGVFRFFAYSDPQDAEPKVEPDQTWTFSGDEARQRLHQDAVGWAYSFWLPFGPPDGAEQRFSLRASFTPAPPGHAVLSARSLVLLPGKTTAHPAHHKTTTARHTESDAAEPGAPSPQGQLPTLTRIVPRGNGT